MPLKGLKQESVSDKGRWRVASFGTLASEPIAGVYPFLNVFLAPLGDDSRIAGELIRRAIPIGELPLLEINAILQDGVLQEPLERDRIREVGTRTKLSVSTRRADLFVFDRLHKDDAGRLIIPQSARWASDDATRQCLFVGFRLGDDPFGLCVPCVEILRFFYATSSVLARAITCGWAVEPSRYMWDPERCSEPDDRGRAHVHLRKRMLDADAAHVARFAFDEYALVCAAEVFLSAAGRTAPIVGTPNPYRIVRALPPFEQDDVELTVQGVKIQVPDGGSRILGMRIDRCMCRPPFNELTFSRDNDGRKDETDTPERKLRKRRPVFLQPSEINPDNLSKVLKRPPGPGQPPLQRLTLRPPESRMPWLDDVAIRKVEREPAKTRSTGRHEVEIAPSSEGSVLPPSADGAASTDQVVIEGPRPANQEVDVPRPGDGAELAIDNQRVIEALLTLDADDEADVIFVAVPGRKQGQMHGVVANAFSIISGSRSRWPLIDVSTGRPRLAAVAELREASGRLRYVIEIEHKTSHECSTLIAWRTDNGSLSAEHELAVALDCCQEKAKATLAGIESLGIRWRRFRHAKRDMDAQSRAVRLQAAIFGTHEQDDDDAGAAEAAETTGDIGSPR